MTARLAPVCLHVLAMSMSLTELGRSSPTKGPATPARTPVHPAYPDGGAAAATDDIEAGALNSGYGNLTPVAGNSSGGGAAGAVAAEALEVIGRVGATVSSVASARASSFAPRWIVRLRPGAKAGCQTTYLMALHLIALRCVI